MKKLVIGGSSVVLLFGGLWFLNRGPSDVVADLGSAKLSSPAGTPVAGASSGGPGGVAGSALARGAASLGVAALPSAGDAGGVGAGADVAAVGPDFKFERREDLDLFRDLKKRVLPSADDRQEKARLLQDAALLRALTDLLKTQNMSEETLRDQTAALDLLVDALQSGSTEAASVLQAVIMDPQIENASVPLKTRENLAGLKAEALYQWSAVNPSARSQLAAMLPGPASQKIWANVIERQDSNRAESAAEIAQRK